MIDSIEAYARAVKETNGVFISRYDIASRKFTEFSACDLDISRLFSAGKILLSTENGKPRQISNELNCFWIILPDDIDDCPSAYVMGPVLIAAISKNQVFEYYHRNGQSILDAQNLAEEYLKIPIISYQLLLNFYALLYYMVRGEKADLSELGLPKEQTQILEVKLNEEDIYSLQKRNFEDETKAEQYLCDCVRSGNVEALNQVVAYSPMDLNFLASNELRSFKNTMIVAVALITRAAIEGGLPVETAFPLSDYYITQTESSRDMTSTIAIQGKAVTDFTTRVRDNQFKLQYSKTVNRCCGYIVANVHRRVMVSELAKREGIHPDTLIRRFKRETGKTIVEYTRYIKVSEAKTLLHHSKKSIAEVASLLGFSSQSQFIYAFKESEGMTPSTYRKNVLG